MRRTQQVLTAAMLLLGVAVPALAGGIVVVGEESGIPGAVTVSSLDAALDLVTTTDADTIYLPPGTYVCNIEWNEDDPAVRIVGRGTGYDPAAPLQVVIQAAIPGKPVVWLRQVTSSVVIEGVTLTGGNRGVRVDGGGGGIVFNRCFIKGNSGHGVHCKGDRPQPTFVNCSIYANGADGVHVAAFQGGAPGNAEDGVEILHCTILQNTGSGVYVANNAAAQVRNTLVYDNTGSGSGVATYEYLVGRWQDDSHGLNLPAALGSEWAFGAPLGQGGDIAGNPDPAEANTGGDPPTIAGVNLAGDYRPNLDGDEQWAVAYHDDPYDIEPTMAITPTGLFTVPGGTVVSVGWVGPQAAATIGDLNLVLQLLHPCVRSLKAVLEHEGVEVTLFDGPGEYCMPGLIDVVLDDEAGTGLGDPGAGSIVGFDGAFRPAESLSAFDGLPMLGQWWLKVTDQGGSARYEYLTDFGAFGFEVDPSSEWSFTAPTGQGGAINGNADPTGDFSGGVSDVINVNPNGDYVVNVDGVYPNGADGVVTPGVTGPSVETAIREWRTSEFTFMPPSGEAVIGDLNVEVDVEHFCANALKMKLWHDGKYVVLCDQVGDCTPNFENTLFDDDAATGIAAGAPPFNNVFRPQGSLAEFDGMPFEGTWKLEVYDYGALAAEYEFLTENQPGPGELTPDGLAGAQWEPGEPQGYGGPPGPGNPDPPAGVEVYGVNLAGNYSTNIDGDAQYPNPGPFDLSFVQATATPTADDNVVTSVLDVDPANTAVVGDVNVVFTLTHPHTGDLTAVLRHEGVTVPLFAHVGGLGADFQATVLDDEANTPINDGAPPFSSAFKPMGSEAGLSAFDGLPVQGPWDLEIYDEPGGGILLDEPFDTEPLDPTWTGYGSDWLVDPGADVYRNAVLGPLVSVCEAPEAQTWTDYTFSTHIEVNDWTGAVSGDNELGIVFRTQAMPDRYYKLVFKNFEAGEKNITFALFKYDGATPTAIYGPQVLPLFWEPFGTPLHLDLSVKVEGNQFEFSGKVMSIPVGPISVSDVSAAYDHGSVGFVARNLFAAFDYATVVAVGESTGELVSWGLYVEPMHYLTTPGMDFADDDEVWLNFKRWLNTGADSIATLECFDPQGGGWQVLYENADAEVTDSAWQDIEYDISGFAAGQSGVRVRWGYHAGKVPYSGWNVHDVVLLVPTTGTLQSWNLYVEPMYYVTTPALDFLGDTRVDLQFAQYLNAGADSIATVECFNPGSGTWEVVYGNAGAEVADNAWQEVIYDLTLLAANKPGVQVRWGYHAGQAAYSGWNVDDVRFLVEPQVSGAIGAWSLEVEPMYYLTSDPMDFSDLALGETVDLRFYRWLNTGPDSIATVECSTDNENWDLLWRNTEEILDAAWVQQTVSLWDRAPTHDAFRVRWGYHAGQIPYSGWNLDDITIVTGATSGGGLVAEEMAVTFGSHNCSYGHDPNDRINFDDAAGAMDVDPDLNTAHEWGKLNSTSDLINAGDGGFTLAPYTDTDFEGHPRAIDPGGLNPAPDIGADEVVATGVVSWTTCVVTAPNGQVGIIGETAPGELQVLITLSGAEVPQEVFIAPQGVYHSNYFLDPEWFIALEPSGLYWTNADPITTVLVDGDASGDASVGDLIADGHGAVWVWALGNFAEPTGQAVTGRHVLIDTVAPVLDVQWNGGGVPASHFAPSSNDGFTAGVAIGDDLHPGYPSPAGTIQGDFEVPEDDGQVVPRDPLVTRPGDGARIFFNVGSIANSQEPMNLDALITASFIDPPVADAESGAILLSAADEVVGLINRQVSGFDADPETLDVVEVSFQLGPLPPGDVLFSDSGVPARWIEDTGGLEQADVAGLYAVAGDGSNVGYDPADHIVTTFENNWLTAHWTFVDGDNGSPGIPWFFGDTGDMYRLSAQFAAVDRAGNWTKVVLDPVHLYWMVRTAVEITPKDVGEVTVHDASFSWHLVRSASPHARNQPTALFSYRVWCRSEDDQPGMYSDVTGWVPWTPETSTPWSLFPNLREDLLGKSVLLVVIGMDEAGNVTPWPVHELDYDRGTGDIEKLVSATHGLNWVEFDTKARPKPTEQIRTTLTPVFWYERMHDEDGSVVADAAYTAGFDGAALGSATKLLLPKNHAEYQLLAKMVIRASVPEDYSEDKVLLDWELDAPGWSWGGFFDTDDPDGSRLIPPNEATAPPPYFVQPLAMYCNFPADWDSSLGAFEPDPYDLQHVCTVYVAFPNDLKKKLPCTFRVRTRVGEDTDALVDPTAARFFFTVTPTLSETVHPRDTADKQPVVITGTVED